MEPDEADRERLAEMLKRAFGEQLKSPTTSQTSLQPHREPATVAKSLSSRAGDAAGSAKSHAAPLSFTPELLRAVLSGQKTQTRRPMRPQPVSDGVAPAAPYAPGDVIAVLEKWARLPGDAERFVFAIDSPDAGVRWNASRYMPHRAARTFLKVESIESSRLTQITEADAQQEGVEADSLLVGEARGRFLMLWDSIYGQTEFAAATDPWVWVIRFSLCGPVVTS